MANGVNGKRGRVMPESIEWPRQPPPRRGRRRVFLILDLLVTERASALCDSLGDPVVTFPGHLGEAPSRMDIWTFCRARWIC
jgi:hypothetical protein